MAKRPARANRMGAIALSLGIMVGIGACSPVHTLDIFDPSDGVRAVLDGEIRATNLLILTGGAGNPGTLVGSLTNTTGETLEVEVLVDENEPILVEIDAHHTAYLTPKNPDFDGASFAFDAQIPSVATPPGGTADVTLATASGGATSVQVPVLDGTLEPYDEYLP